MTLITAAPRTAWSRTASFTPLAPRVAPPGNQRWLPGGKLPFSGDSGAEDIVAGQGQARRRAGEQLAAEWCAVCCSKYMCGSGPAMCTPG